MKYTQLTREQRYAIYLGFQEGKSQKAIALQIGVHPSTVSREIKRNRNRFGRYWWRRAEEDSRIRRERGPGNRSVKAWVMKEALGLLKKEEWSPRQISGYLALRGISISHETIYARIRADGEGELRRHCRHGMRYRHHRRIPARRKCATSLAVSAYTTGPPRPTAPGSETGRWT